MFQDSSIRRSVDEYVKHRMREIPSEIDESFVNLKKVWKCENDIDFLYGYYVGKIEESALHYLLKATRASAGGYVDTFEIRGIIETHRKQLRELISKSLSK